MLKNSVKSNVVREKGSHKWALLRGGGWASPTYNDQMSTLSFPKENVGIAFFRFCCISGAELSGSDGRS